MSWATKQQQKQVKLGIWLNLLPPGMLGHLKRRRKIFVLPIVFVKDRFIKSYERWAQMSSIPWETHLWGKEVFMRFCKNLLCFHFKPWHHFLLFNFQKSSFAQFWVGRSPMSGKLCFPSIFILVCDNEQWYCPNYLVVRAHDTNTAAGQLSYFQPDGGEISKLIWRYVHHRPLPTSLLFAQPPQIEF